jgi:hypothetical protein
MLGAMNRLCRAAAIAALVSLVGGCGDSTARLDAGEAARDVASPDGDATLPDADAAHAAGDAGDAVADAVRDAPGQVVTGPPNACAAGAAWFDLPYTVAGAAYSRARGLLVLRPETEHAIYLIAPDTCDAARIALPRLPMSIAVSPTEADIAVGQDGMVSLIDVASGAVRATISIPAPATEIAFDALGRVVVFSRALTSISTQLLVVDPAGGGTVTAVGALDGGGHLRATADGAGLFWTVDAQTTADVAARIVVGRSPLLGNPVAAGPMACHELFPTDDSRQLVTACGTVLGLSSADPKADLAPAGALEGVTQVEHADTIVAKGLAAVLPTVDASLPPAQSFVRIHATKDLSFVGNLPLPVLDTGSEHQTPLGRYVFLRADGTRAYVLARRQPGQAPVDGVAILDPAQAGNADAPTLKIASSFPHRSGLPQPVNVPRVAATLAFGVIDAGYSRVLNRLVMSSIKPTDAVFLVDPATGDAEPLPTPTNPSTIAVRADGLVAAVTRDGGIRFLDLQKRTLLRDVDGPATSVAFGAGSEVLLATGASTSSWLDLDTGATRAASSTTGETPGFTTVPGTSSFYSMRGRGLVRHDDTIAPADPSFDLAAFVSPEAIVKPCATPFWVTDDGSNLVLDCSRVFSLSPDRALDLRYLGFLEAVSRLDHVAYAPSTHRFFSVPEVFVLAGEFATGIGRIAVHDDQFLDLVSVIDLGTFPGGTALSQPLRVFMGQTPKQIIVVAESDFFAPPTHAVYTLDVTGL